MTRREPDPYERLPLAPRDFLILLALVDGALHGYGLVRAVEEESEGQVHMDPANLYRSLRRMERDGLVEETSSPAPESAEERRRYYSLTSFGRRVVSAEAARVSRLARAAEAKRLVPRGAR